jgi:streptogramin lyase
MASSQRQKTAAVVSFLLLCSLVGATPAQAAAVAGLDVLYSSGAEFDLGDLDSVNHQAPHGDQLRLDRQPVTFSYVNVAASSRGTVIRAEVNTGAIVGEWTTAPAGRGRNPSRTAIDRDGNVWVANRDETQTGRGSVTRIGVIHGGSRVNADGTANPAGNLLRGPFSYNTCQDRNGDGLIATSRGLGDIRPWTNAGGADTNGGVVTAADECLITYSRVAGSGTRTVAVDGNNDVWTGGSDSEHEKLDGTTGAAVAGTLVNFGCGGYGGLVDRAGTVWSARYGNNLLRYVPGGTGVCYGTAVGDEGLGEDPVTGEIWHTSFCCNKVTKLAPNGTVLGSFTHGSSSAQGVAVDGAGNVWVAHSQNSATTVGHLRTDGTYVGNVALPAGRGPTAVSVDINGKIWVTNTSTNNIQRIDPNAGPVGGGGFRVGAVDLTVSLGAGAGPVNYSDLTASVTGGLTVPSGSWRVVQDGGVADRPWGTITWNTEAEGEVPAGSSIMVEARAAATEPELSAEPWSPVDSGVDFLRTGRYLEVRATLTASPGGDSPVLSDLRIKARERAGGFACQATALDLAGSVVSRANPPGSPCADDSDLTSQAGLNAGILQVQAGGLQASSSLTPDDLVLNPPRAGDGANASARIEWTRITAAVLIIEVGVISASASVTCAAGPGGLTPQFSGASAVAGLKINGLPVSVGTGPVSIALLIGTLRINSTTLTATGLTRHALILDTPLTDVIIGEVKVSTEDNPCEV